MRFMRVPWWGVYTVEPDRICLTFDDGPIPIRSSKICDVLEKRGHRATFFTIGFYNRKRPQFAKELYERGHELANHTWTHKSAWKIKDFDEEIGQSARCIQELTESKAPVQFRPAYGHTTLAMQGYLRKQGLLPIRWSVGPPRPEHKCSVQELVASYRKAKVRGGDIILMHDDSPHILETLPYMLDLIEDLGLRSTPLTRTTELRVSSPCGVAALS